MAGGSGDRITAWIAVIAGGRLRSAVGVADLDVRRAIAGEVDAFERLYRQHERRVYSLARRMLGSEVEAEDATQEIFVQTWKKLAGFRGESTFATWLHRLARNSILNRLRQRKGAFEELSEEMEEAATAHGSHHQRLDLAAGIAGLPSCARAVFILHEVEGLRHDEIASDLGIAIGTSKSQLHRARLLLRRYLGEGGDA